MDFVNEKAFAKINLYLDVLGKRPDGYHDIKSVMHTVSLCDDLRIERAEGIAMTCSDSTLSCGEDNLCIRAARAFFDGAGIEGGVLITLEKVIPSQAGLGGGSADAAAVLRGMNRLYGEPLTVSRLCELGAGLGADVPFCVLGGSRLAEGIGERLTEYYPLPDCYIVIVKGEDKVSTPEAYRIIDSLSPAKKGDFKTLEAGMRGGDIDLVCRGLYNRFEDTLPQCEMTKKILLDAGALGALMSGSGSAVFGIFKTERDASSAMTVLEKSGREAFLCTPKK